ncbi:uncharacterized protein LOC111627740 [Centruroides sculpturatus]|uniref:uncharacterized protein LOC111627740 n=1 Tax=Centruroides sculpturatus TaxID=218467 RepID=UPI000C6D2FAD|nr:uncharacterized protein LOC111627740 [Centruroides sculpturatus]
MIPTFSNSPSDNVNIIQFFRTMDNIARLAKWGDDVKIAVLQAKLKGDPLSTFMCLLEHTPIPDFGEIKRNLIKCYEKFEGRERGHLDQLLNIKQGGRELISDYIVRTKTVMSRAIQENRTVVSFKDDVIKERFIRGLHQNIRCHVSRREPETLEQAFEWAEKEERVERECGSSREIRNIGYNAHSDQRCEEGRESANPVMLHRDDDRLASLEKGMKSLLEVVTKLVETRPERRDYPGRRCFICDSPNHLARRCPNRKSHALN